MKKFAFIALLAAMSASACAAPAKDFATMSWQEASETAASVFQDNFDANDVQKPATACGKTIRSIWNKPGSYSTTFAMPQYENFKLEVFANNGNAGCKVTAK